MFGNCVPLFAILLVSACAAIEPKQCKSSLVETIPQDLSYNETIISKDTHLTIVALIKSAKFTIDIASFYWTLLGKDVMPNPVPESSKGEDILKALVSVKSRSVKVRIAVNDDKNTEQSEDLAILRQVAEVKKVNFTRLVGAGILHTKFLIVDNESFYLGSANMDWRSLTHVKELGVFIGDCPSLAQDLANTFNVYWYLGGKEVVVPKSWPLAYSAKYNSTNPQRTALNGHPYDVFISSSPAELCPSGRTNDIDAILSIIDSAEEYIYIAVMDYFPIFLYKQPTIFWPVIDNALRKAAIERKVTVKLLGSHWNHTRASMSLFLKSLQALSNKKILRGSIETRLFTVPSFTPTERNIPFARVNHNKYMVTDKVAYIGTSNWSADYFVSTGGVGIAISTPSRNETNLHDQLKSIFERDWNSKYSNAL